MNRKSSAVANPCLTVRCSLLNAGKHLKVERTASLTQYANGAPGILKKLAGSTSKTLLPPVRIAVVRALFLSLAYNKRKKVVIIVSPIHKLQLLPSHHPSHHVLNQP